MQIRERGKKVVCIKTEYVPEKKRTYGKTVASQPKYMSTVSDEVCQQLTKEEVDELQKWLDDRQKERNVDSIKADLSIIRSVSNGAAEALERELGELTDDQAAEIWAGIARLQKALKKAGHPRPQRQPKKPAADNRQGKLV